MSSSEETVTQEQAEAPAPAAETVTAVVDVVQESEVSIGGDGVDEAGGDESKAEAKEEEGAEPAVAADEVKKEQPPPDSEVEQEKKQPDSEVEVEQEKKQATPATTAKLEPEQVRKVFIGSLSYSTVEEGLRKHFSQFGDIIDCVVMKEGKSNKSRGFGFVTYTSSSMVDELMKNRPHKLDGRELETKRATPREEIGKPGAEVSVTKLFVGGVRNEVNEEHLKEYFSKFGNVLDVNIMREKESQRSRGFGFVTFDDYDPVDKIVLDKFHTINGHSIAVKKALTKEQQQVGGPIIPSHQHQHSNGHDAKPYSRPRNRQQNGGGFKNNRQNHNQQQHPNQHHQYHQPPNQHYLYNNNNHNHYGYGNDYAPPDNYPPMHQGGGGGYVHYNHHPGGGGGGYNSQPPARYNNYQQYQNYPPSDYGGYDAYDDKPPAMNGNGYAANDYPPQGGYSNNRATSPNLSAAANPIGNMNLGNIALFAQKMLQAASMQLQSTSGTVPSVPLGAGPRKMTAAPPPPNDDLNGYDSYQQPSYNNYGNNGMMGSAPNAPMYGGNGMMMTMDNGQVGPIRAHNGMGGGGGGGGNRGGRNNGPYGGGRRKN